MRYLIAEIVRAKREGRIEPALATELELKQALAREGGYDISDWIRIRAEIEELPDIVTHRLLKCNGYEIRDYADITETTTKELFTKEGGSGATPTRK
jgi:hypothetical protein